MKQTERSTDGERARLLLEDEGRGKNKCKESGSSVNQTDRQTDRQPLAAPCFPHFLALDKSFFCHKA
jgi:hypothetical protein